MSSPAQQAKLASRGWQRFTLCSPECPSPSHTSLRSSKDIGIGERCISSGSAYNTPTWHTECLLRSALDRLKRYKEEEEEAEAAASTAPKSRRISWQSVPTLKLSRADEATIVTPLREITFGAPGQLTMPIDPEQPGEDPKPAVSLHTGELIFATLPDSGGMFHPEGTPFFARLLSPGDPDAAKEYLFDAPNDSCKPLKRRSWSEIRDHYGGNVILTQAGESSAVGMELTKGNERPSVAMPLFSVERGTDKVVLQRDGTGREFKMAKPDDEASREAHARFWYKFMCWTSEGLRSDGEAEDDEGDKSKGGEDPFGRILLEPQYEGMGQYLVSGERSKWRNEWNLIKVLDKRN